MRRADSASAPTPLNRTGFVRLPYVKYSTGADRTTRTACRALGKPDSTTARRAFLAGSAIGEWHSRGQRFDPAYLHHRSLENHWFSRLFAVLRYY